jgi:site-specific DNA recombinase
LKVAIYARYSSDNQRDASIADQLRVCRDFAARQGWTVVQEFADHAISGATLLRSGFQALMRAALNAQFDIVLANELYIGRVVWNRLRYVKDPDTGKRVSRPNHYPIG